MSLLDLGHVLSSVMEYLPEGAFRHTAFVHPIIYHHSHYATIFFPVTSTESMCNPSRFRVVDCICNSPENLRQQIARFSTRIRRIDCWSNLRERLPPGLIPSQVQYLTLPAGYRHPFEIGTLPSSLVTFRLPLGYRAPLTPGVLPRSLRCLTLGDQYNHALEPGVLPEDLEVLIFGSEFNHPIRPGDLPPRLLKLTFGYDFDRSLPVGVFPDSINELTFGASFGHRLRPGVLPKHLKKLTMGRFWMRSLSANVLPEGLTCLQLGPHVAGIATGALPMSLRSLTVAYRPGHGRLEVQASNPKLKITWLETS